VNAAIEDNCNVIRYSLTKPQDPSKYNAFLAVLTRRLSLLPEINPEIAPATSHPGNPDVPSYSDKTQLKMAETTKNSPISATPALFINTSQHIPTQKSTNPLQCFSRTVGQILNTKNTLFGHKRTKPAITYQKCPKRSNSSTKRSVNQRPSFKTNNMPRKPPNVCLPANP
jgi:hypothetical protein